MIRRFDGGSIEVRVGDRRARRGIWIIRVLELQRTMRWNVQYTIDRSMSGEKAGSGGLLYFQR